MPVLKDSDKELVKKEFQALQNPVKLAMFTQKIECEFCEETRQMTEELASLSDKITPQIYNFVIDKEAADKYGIDKIPAVVVLGDSAQGEVDYGIRFYGIPAGYEFSALVDAIKAVSSGASGLSAQTKALLGQIDQSVHLQVFTTPT